MTAKHRFEVEVQGAASVGAARAPSGPSALNLALAARRVRADAARALRADPIAIIGMGCRTPGGVTTPEELWTLLRDGRDAIGPVPAERWDPDAWFDPDPAAPGKSLTRRGGFLDRIDGFDAGYFEILPREAERMDPQQRLLLEVAIEALDDAGLPDSRLRSSRTGVFVASYHNDYAQLQYGDLDAVDARTLTGTLHSVLTNRLSYFLDLRGPSISIDTACSSSLVAIHLACQSLRYGESDLALAGGVSLMITPELMVSLSKVGFMAPDGRCKTFEDRADGFGRGEGCGMIVLKRLADAVADDDRVLAVVRGSAVNSDGRSTLLAAPNGLAQQAMVREALANAQIDASRIGYVEAHGTGTALGDPIEVEALAATVGLPSEGAGPCYLGAAKANIGHLEAGAGVIGVIKTVLALRHDLIPPQPNFGRLSPHISLAGSRLAIADRPIAWPAGASTRCAGISSFGVGGTNAHVVLEEAPRLPIEHAASPVDDVALLPLSAKSPEALRAAARSWADWLTTTDASLDDLCYTAAERRSHHAYRLAVVGADKPALAARLDAFARDGRAPGVFAGRRPLDRARVAFVFSGQGPQWHAMGRELLAQEPVFHAAIAECDALLRPLSGWSLLEELSAEEPASRLAQTLVAQPALFALQVGLAAWWRSRGVHPDAVIGHSVGEIAALHVAGVLTLADAVRIVWHRGRIMQEATGLGRMAAVGLEPSVAAELVSTYGDRLSVAAVNGPRSVVLSGEEGALREALERLAARGVAQRLLAVDYAFHSAQMAPFEQRLVDAIAGVRGAEPSIEVYSTVTGSLLGPASVGPAYFGRNVRAPVRFADAIAAMTAAGDIDAFVEIGPHPVLSGAIAECLGEQAGERVVVASLRRGRPERESLIEGCARLYAVGVLPDWEAFRPRRGSVVELPAYPWQRKRHWIRSRPALPTSANRPVADELLGTRSTDPDTGRIAFRGEASSSHSWLGDHRLQGRVVLPAAAVLQMFAAVGRDALGDTAGTSLVDFSIARPLVVDEDDPDAGWEVAATSAGPNEARLYLCETRRGERVGDVVARADVRRAEPFDLPMGSVQAASSETDRPTRELDLDAAYRRFADLGATFGPAFRTLGDVRIGDGIADGTIDVSLSLPPAGSGLHPTVLDGALQLCSLAAGRDDHRAVPERLWLPLGADRVRLGAGADGPVRARARVRRGTASLSADIVIRNADGALIAAIDGLHFAPASADAFAPSFDLDRALYAIDWQRSPPPAALRGPGCANGTWLLLVDQGGTGDALAERLRGLGARCIQASVGSVTASSVHDRWTIDPSGPDGFRAVLASAGPLRAVLHLWSIDMAQFDVDLEADDDTAEPTGLASALSLVQALAGAAPAPLWLVTRGARTVTGDEPAERLCPRAAGLVGLAGVVAAEHPELQVRQIDLDPATTGSGLDGLLESLLASPGGERESAWRNGERWTPRLVTHRAAARAVGGSPTSAAPVQWVVTSAGTLDGAALVPMPPSAALAADRVRVEVMAAGVNFRDVLLTLGMYDGPSVPLGAECAGTVRAVGAAVTAFRPGDLVFGYAPGSLATLVDVPAAFLARLPVGLGVTDAAALPVAFFTAWYGLHRLAGLKAGDRVLIHAAAGGVGMAAVQWALRCGAQVYATAGSPEKRAMLLDRGVAHVASSRSLDFAEAIRAATGGAGVDVVLNSLAGDFIPASLDLVAPGGHFLELGKRAILDPAEAARLRPDVHYAAYDLGSEAEADTTLLPPMFDALLGALADGSLAPLPVTPYPFSEAPAAFRYMARARHVGKVVLKTGSAPEVAGTTSYLITGGLGGLGLETARWLVGCGARNLALTGRRPPGAAAARQLDVWRAEGVQVLVFEADAGDAARMAEVFAAIDERLPPLRGVFHAAGSFEPGLLLQQTPAGVREVLRGKARGARVLHAATRHRPLDFFVLYSAAGVLLGAAGQGVYAGANAELDALALARRRAGLPALSVAWGAWAEVGMAAAAAARGRDAWGSRGLREIDAAFGFAALERLLRDGAAYGVVLPIDWSRFVATLPGGIDAAFFDAVRKPATRAAAAPSEVPLHQRLAGLPSTARRPALRDELRRRVLEVLGLEPDHPIDDRQPLKDIGLDSLMAVELRNALARAYALPLPVTLLFDYPTLDLLCACVLGHLGLDGEAATGATAPNRPSGALASELAVSALSDAEAEAELLRELGPQPSGTS